MSSTTPTPYVPNHERTQKILPTPVVAPQNTSADVANPRNTLASVTNPQNSSANPASVSEKSFSNKPTGRASVGEVRKDLAGYRTDVKDKPKEYVGKRRAKEAPEPVATVFLAIETVDGLGDSVIGASMDYSTAVGLVQKFAGRLGEGEVFPDNHTSLTLAGQRLRTADGKLSPYKIFPVVLDR